MTGEVGPERLGIVGLGLIGGSLARSLKEGSRPPWIVASSLDVDELESARKEGVIDRGEPDPGQVAASADLVVYATPLEATLELLERHRERWSRGAVITDVAGLKVPVLERARELGFARRLVGGHPMAGTEGRGYAASRGDLFRDEEVYLVRGRAEAGAAETVRKLWIRAGARPTWIEADAHDRQIVWSSHFPQMVSTAVARVLAARDVRPDALGPGGRDVTRLAASPSRLWSEILSTAPGRDLEALRALLRELSDLVGRLEGPREERKEAVRRYLEEGRRWRAEPGAPEDEGGTA